MMRRFGVSLLKGGAFLIYSLLKVLPVQQKLVLISRLSTTPSIDFQYITQAAATRHPETKVVVLNHKMTNRFTHIFAILQEMYHLATAKACVVESYVISVSILHHRKSLKIVQIWHALGAVKAFGHSAIGKAEGSSREIAQLMHMHRNYNNVTAGSARTIPIFAKAFNVPPSVIVPIGMPRVDYLLDANIQQGNKAAVTQRFALPPQKKVILYAPTFRKGTKIPYEDLMGAVDASQYTLIITQHPHDRTTIRPHNNVIINQTFNVLQLLPVADYVITDYSAVVFEAALLHKPLFFWVFDENRYTKRRGFAMDYPDELPGLRSQSAKDIIAGIQHDRFDQTQINTFANKYISVQDGSSTRRLFELLGIATS